MNIRIPDQAKVIARYGPDAQALVHCEEAAEFIQAVSKMRRARNAGKDDSAAYGNLVEEVADTLICLGQVREMYSISDRELQAVIDRKCARQEARIRGNV